MAPIHGDRSEAFERVTSMVLFNEDETADFERITVLYNINKRLMLYAEELTDETFLPPINEIRDTNDHLMRVFAAKLGFGEDGPETIGLNLDAAFSHLYRATYEHLDYIKIYQIEAIQIDLENIHNDALVAVFPEYYREIKPRLTAAIEKIPEYRDGKNIADPDFKLIEEYMAIIESIKTDYKKIGSMLPALIEYQAKQKEDNRREKLMYVILGIILTFFGTVAANIF